MIELILPGRLQYPAKIISEAISEHGFGQERAKVFICQGPDTYL